MGSVEIVVVCPWCDSGVSLFGGCIGSRRGPFAQECLDEALGLAVGSQRVELGADVMDAGAGEGPGEEL